MSGISMIRLGPQDGLIVVFCLTQLSPMMKVQRLRKKLLGVSELRFLWQLNLLNLTPPSFRVHFGGYPRRRQRGNPRFAVSQATVRLGSRPALRAIRV